MPSFACITNVITPPSSSQFALLSGTSIILMKIDADHKICSYAGFPVAKYIHRKRKDNSQLILESFPSPTTKKVMVIVKSVQNKDSEI